MDLVGFIGLLLFLSFILVIIIGVILLIVSIKSSKNQIINSLNNNDSFLTTSFKFSYKANLIFWVGILVVSYFWEDFLPRKLSLIEYLIIYIICTLITTFITELLLTYIIKTYKSLIENVFKKSTTVKKSNVKKHKKVAKKIVANSTEANPKIFKDNLKTTEVSKDSFIIRNEEISLKSKIIAWSKTKYGSYLGIFLGGIYGLLIRGIFEAIPDSIFSLTFVIIVPILIALIPILLGQQIL